MTGKRTTKTFPTTERMPMHHHVSNTGAVVQRAVQVSAQMPDDDSRSCAEFIPSPIALDPIPYRVHSSAWPVRYALTDGGEDALRALAGEL